VVYDKDFDAPLPGVEVLNTKTQQKVETTEQGNYLFPQVPAGEYTLVFSKEGYVRQVRADVGVTAGKLTEVEVWMPGDFTEMDEFLVEEAVGAGAGSEAALLDLRLDSPALLDSVGIDLMSKAGASDAAGALTLVAGATVKDGKTAVIRGLPDRYVSSQLNGVRLPSADEDKRAVELDQFPAAIIESIQVSKSFTPDQQGDASGGAVNVKLKGIPGQATFFVKGEYGYNSQASNRGGFLTYTDGGVDFLGQGGDRDIQWNNVGGNWTGPVGVSRGNSPTDSKFSFGGGTQFDLGKGWRLGAFGSFFHENDSSYFDDGFDDSFWVDLPGSGLTPEYTQGAPSLGNPVTGDFRTKLFDITQGKEAVQIAALGILGIENEHHHLGITYLYSHSAEDEATLAENTRGKQYYFPGHDPYDQNSPGHGDSLDSSPYLRLETLQYTERTIGSLQFTGTHNLPIGELEVAPDFKFQEASFDWVFAKSSALLDQPDKRQFGSYWLPEREVFPGFSIPATYYPYKPAALFSLGNLQRIWKRIEENSTQYALGLNWPFEQWSHREGYLKAGYFSDVVEREFNQDTFSNFGDAGATFAGDWTEYWSAQFPFENHPFLASDQDIDYDGRQEIRAFYGMGDLPLNGELELICGARFETTEISVVNDAEPGAVWFPPGFEIGTTLQPGEADVSVARDDFLPSLGLVYDATDEVSLRASYSQTIARQTFKELTPILQQEFLGGPIFIGNPGLEMSSLDNFDLRLDYRPEPGSLLSISGFYKEITKPIEYVQRATTFTFTTPVNYPKGRLTGFELEGRKSLGVLADELEGFSVGANATFIASKVWLPDDEIQDFSLPAVQAPLSSRDMTGAPDFLYNVYITYDIDPTDTHFGLFYNIQGDTLIAGAALDDNNLVPSIYARKYEQLNFSLRQGIGEYFTLTLKAKNLTNPHVETFYRSDYIAEDTTRSSFRRGIDYSISLGAEFSF
jgi:outer membrane receptor protein involved in Fe transport